MTRKDMINKLCGWFWEWAKLPEKYEYFEDKERETRLRTNKLNELNAMTTEALRELYVSELIRRESHAKEQS